MQQVLDEKEGVRCKKSFGVKSGVNLFGLKGVWCSGAKVWCKSCLV